MTQLEEFLMEHDKDLILTYATEDPEMDDPERLDRITVEEAIITAERSFLTRDPTGYEHIRMLLAQMEYPSEETAEAVRLTRIPELSSFLGIAHQLHRHAEEH
jgi:hypothetical protein